MVRKRLLVLLKPFDVYPSRELTATSTRYSEFLHDRMVVHKNAISLCMDILRKKFGRLESVFRNDISQPIRDVDLVITIGGDGTLLHASHFMDDSVPVLGVNSDPTRLEEVETHIEEFDATRSTGYLCAATANNFEQMIDNIVEDGAEQSELARIAVNINSQTIPTCALNDVLLAHPCPATVSRFSFRITQNGKPLSPLQHCRSSGLRISTAAGSTAAMLSAGGFAMPILSKELQYMVREPICNSMHGLVKSEETMDIRWSCKEGFLYIDGCDVVYSVQSGDIVKISSMAPTLKVYLPPHLLSQNL